MIHKDISIFCSILLLAFVHETPAQAQHPAFNERIEERLRMVSQEIEHYSYRQVHDEAVLAAMRTVPRHSFVPKDLQEYAYENRPLPIGYEQTISQPFIVASMTELLQLENSHKVLEIGTGSGYQAAVLAEICDSVFSIEIVPQLGKRARKTLEELGYENVKLKVGNGYLGWSEHAPFDRMIVTCAPDEIPEELINQLAPGGRMIIPVGSPWQIQNLILVKKGQNGALVQERQYPVRFVPMTGEKED